jgi:ketosteroid isomerase-like protein
MRTNGLLLCAALCLAATACFADDRNSRADETRAVEQANAEFYASLNALFTGDYGPMENVWSHAEDVIYMGPAGGFQIGWDAVRANWQAQAAKKFGGRVEPAETRFIVGDELAFSVCYERGSNSVQGQVIPVAIRATNVFRKENGQWKMVGHHTDILPFLQKQAFTGSIDRTN